MRGRGLLVLVDRLGEGQGGDDKERTKYLHCTAKYKIIFSWR
jgi:hypothetical protein